MPEQPQEVLNTQQQQAASPETPAVPAAPPSESHQPVAIAPVQEKKGLFGWLNFGGRPKSQGPSIFPSVDVNATGPLNAVAQARSEGKTNTNIMTGMSPDLEPVGAQSTTQPVAAVETTYPSNLSSQRELEEPGWDSGKPPTPAVKPSNDNALDNYDVLTDAEKVAQQAPGAAEVEINAAAEAAMINPELPTPAPQPGKTPTQEPVLAGAPSQPTPETNNGNGTSKGGGSPTV